MHYKTWQKKYQVTLILFLNLNNKLIDIRHFQLSKIKSKFLYYFPRILFTKCDKKSFE